MSQASQTTTIFVSGSVTCAEPCETLGEMLNLKLIAEESTRLVNGSGNRIVVRSPALYQMWQMVAPLTAERWSLHARAELGCCDGMLYVGESFDPDALCGETLPDGVKDIEFALKQTRIPVFYHPSQAIRFAGLRAAIADDEKGLADEMIECPICTGALEDPDDASCPCCGSSEEGTVLGALFDGDRINAYGRAWIGGLWPETAPDDERPYVLVVIADTLKRLLTSQFLEQHGYRTIPVASIDEAVSALEEPLHRELIRVVLTEWWFDDVTAARVARVAHKAEKTVIALEPCFPPNRGVEMVVRDFGELAADLLAKLHICR